MGILDLLRGGQAQVPGSTQQPQGLGLLSQLLDPSVALPMAGALMGQQGNGQNFGNALSAAAPAMAQQQLTAQTNKTGDFLRKQDPRYADMLDNGFQPKEVYEMYLQDRKAQTAQNPFQERATAAQQYGLDPNTPEGRRFVLSGDMPSGGGDDYAQRQQAAEQYGLTPDDPRYQSFLLTGKMPREDAQPLTATDKKAILEADEMVAANENAITALGQAEQLSEKANSGWLAGTRATLGNNLPDLMVPDMVSSPDSSVATTDMDNAVVGQALASLKTIFGGNPTEGERAILLQLQGSSSMPVDVRKRVFARAKELAAKRLEFNRQRAQELRGGSFYKPGGGATGQGGGNRTTSGVSWSVEP